MATKDILFTIFEFLLYAGVVLAMIFEYKLINFENKLKKKIKKFLEVIR